MSIQFKKPTASTPNNPLPSHYTQLKNSNNFSARAYYKILSKEYKRNYW